MYRFACTLEEREDQFAEAYFRAARATEQVPEAVRLFQQRAGRAAVPTPAATRALYHALLDRDEPAQANAALDQAIAREALQRIADLYAIEAEIRGRSAEERRAARQSRSKPLLDAMRLWLEQRRAELSRKSPWPKRSATR